MSTLQPVPGPNITDKNQLLLAPWRSWFSALYTYVTQHIGASATSQDPDLTGVLTLNGVQISTGTGSPQTVVTGNPGDIYINTLGGTSTLWVKQSGQGTAGGWTDGPWYGSFYDTSTQTIASTTTWQGVSACSESTISMRSPSLVMSMRIWSLNAFRAGVCSISSESFALSCCSRWRSAASFSGAGGLAAAVLVPGWGVDRSSPPP